MLLFTSWEIKNTWNYWPLFTGPNKNKTFSVQKWPKLLIFDNKQLIMYRARFNFTNLVWFLNKRLHVLVKKSAQIQISPWKILYSKPSRYCLVQGWETWSNKVLKSWNPGHKSFMLPFPQLQSFFSNSNPIKLLWNRVSRPTASTPSPPKLRLFLPSRLSGWTSERLRTRSLSTQSRLIGPRRERKWTIRWFGD